MATPLIEVRGIERFDIVERILGPLEKRNPKQCEFLHQLFDEHKKYILYGGAAGGGKSYILRWACILFLIFCWRVYKVRRVRVGLFCEDYPNLRDRQLSKLASEVPRWMGHLHKTEAEGLIWEMPNDDRFGGGFIAPRNLDKPEKYDSTEFAMMAVDELTKNPREVRNSAGQDKELFAELRKRLRWPGFPASFVFPFVGGTNPGGVGHDWVKQLWIDRDFPPYLKTVEKEFIFIKALSKENAYNPPSYYEDLLTLPDEYRRAYAEGDWDSFMGQFFGKWRRAVHICPKFPIPHYWTRFTAEDWGFAKPWCRLWFAVSPEGRVIAYREQYERRRLPDFMAQEGLRLSEGERVKYRLGDPAMWDEPPGGYGENTGEPIATQLAKHGWELQKANNRRVAGWLHVREYLQWETNAEERLVRAPMFQVMEGTCPNLIRTMPAQVFDKTNAEDLDTDGEDHGPDTLRYGLMSLPKPTIVPLEEMPDEWTEAVMRAAHADRRSRKGQGADLN